MISGYYTSLLTQLTLKMPGNYVWSEGVSSEPGPTKHKASSIHVAPQDNTRLDHYEAALPKSVAISPPTRSVTVEVAPVPIAAVLLDPAAGPRDDGFPDPLTGEFLPHAAITREYMIQLTQRCRQYFRSVFQGFLDRLDGGEDRAVLIAEFNEFYTIKNKIIGRLNPLISWFAAHTSDGPQWHGQYLHRLLRPLNVMNVLVIVLKRPERDPEKYLKQALQGCISDDCASMGLIIWDVCNLLNYASQTYNEKIDRAHFEIRFNDKVKTSFDALDPLVTPFNWDILEQILEELTWNGMKYGETFVEIEWDAEDNALVVTNDGPGIPEGLDIFASGQRGNHFQIEGTGFGLSNALNDARTNGWTLSFTSQPGKTEFRLKLGIV